MRDIGITRATAILGLFSLVACTTPAPQIAAVPGPAYGAPPDATQAVAPGAQPQSTPPPNPMIGGVAMYPSRDIVENLAQSPEHHVLLTALNTAGLADTLKQPGPFTLFAPTDAAFHALPAGLLDQLMQPANRARLVALLNNHVVAGRLDSSSLGHQVAGANGAATLTTLAGTTLVARPNGAVNLLLRDAAGGFADVSIYDIVNANGIVHVIDKVLLPTPTP